MSKSTQVAESIQDTIATISQLESALASGGAVPSALAMIESLRHKQADLEATFLRIAADVGEDVCTYRVFSETTRPTILGISRALEDFQNLFSVVYHALRRGPLSQARVTRESILETSFGFGYAFSGSVGFTLTLPSERLLVGESMLEKTIDSIGSMAKSEAPEQIAKFASTLGAGPIRTMYKWADDHEAFSLGADIEWRHDTDVSRSILVQEAEIARLRNIIDMSGESRVTEEKLRGTLIMANINTRAFLLNPDGTDTVIKGRMVREIEYVELPKVYVATLQRAERTLYSSDVVQVSYTLLGLDVPKA
jgi:hypothetical protein